MPRSATGAIEVFLRARPGGATLPPGAGGFTLIEILVVIVIASVMAGFALLALGRAGPGALNERALARVEAAMTQLCDRALLTGAAHGVRFDDSGYDFWVLRSEGWTELADGDPPEGRWPEDQVQRVEIAGVRLEARNRAAPQVYCTGIEPPASFRIELGRGDSQRSLAWP